MKPPSCLTKIQTIYTANRISLNSIIGVFLGLILGLVVKSIFWADGQPVDPNLLRILSLPGLLFIRCFLILIIPLLIASLSTSFFAGRGTVSSDSSEQSTTDNDDGINAKKLLLLTFVFFVGFSLFTAYLGISLMALVKPGASNNAATVLPNSILNTVNLTASQIDIESVKKRIEHENGQIDSLYNIILNVIPDNLITPLFLTSFTTTETVWPANLSSILEPTYVPTTRQHTSQSFKRNMLGVCALSLVLGLIIHSAGPSKTASIRKLLLDVDYLVKECMNLLLILMPGGMFFWMFTEALKMHSIGQVAGQLVAFYAVLFLGFSCTLVLFYPLVLFVFTRQNPFRLYQNLSSAALVAFGSSSSAITLPMTISCMKEKEGLTETIANSVLPLGMILNMNGSAMYYPMVALFVAQMKSVQVDIFTMIILGIFSVIMTMGFAGAPAGGGVIVNHIAFASILGIEDATDILAYIMAFEWLTERIRTVINIIGDAFVSKCIEQLIVPKGKKKAQIEEQPGTIKCVSETILAERVA